MASKIYFKAASKFIEQEPNLYKKINSALLDLGLVVTREDELLNKYLSPNSKDLLSFYRVAFDEIKESDALVCEVSISSSTVGYEVAYALSLNKPVLLLSKRIDETSPIPFFVNPSKLLTYTEYTSQNVSSKVRQFLRKVEKGIFVKRLPIEFTKNQVDYVQYRQRRDGRKMSFNSAIREIIEEAIDADMVYRDITQETS